MADPCALPDCAPVRQSWFANFEYMTPPMDGYLLREGGRTYGQYYGKNDGRR
jgi:hypothetical protein